MSTYFQCLCNLCVTWMIRFRLKSTLVDSIKITYLTCFCYFLYVEVHLGTDEYGVRSCELVETAVWTVLFTRSYSEILFDNDSVVTFSFHLQRKSENFLTSLFASYVVRNLLRILSIQHFCQEEFDWASGEKQNIASFFLQNYHKEKKIHTQCCYSLVVCRSSLLHLDWCFTFHQIKEKKYHWEWASWSRSLCFKFRCKTVCPKLAHLSWVSFLNYITTVSQILF